MSHLMGLFQQENDEMFGPVWPEGVPRSNRELDERPTVSSAIAYRKQDDPEFGGAAADKARAGSRKKDFHKETERYYESEGWTTLRCDRNIVTYSGAIVTKDLMGIGDRIGFMKGRVALIQITTKDQMRAHVRKIADPKTTIDNNANAKSVRRLAERWLECGHEIHLIGWFQEGGKGSKWLFELQKVTLELLEGADSRRRK